MKQFLRYTLTLVAILIATTNAWAATATCHTVTKSTFTTDATYTKKSWGITYTYYYFSPSDQSSFTISNDLNTISQISFKATGDTRDGDLKFKVIYKTANNPSWQEVGNEVTLARTGFIVYDPGEQTITLNTSNYPNLKNATEIGLRFTRYHNNTEGFQSNKRTITISNESVTFSNYFHSDANGITLEEFPSTEKGTICSTTRSFTYKYNNTVTSVNWVSSNPMFTVSSTHAEDCSEEKEVTITFTPTEIRSEITGTITGTDNNGNKIVIYVKGSSWGKEDPTYTWKPEIWNGTSQARTIYVGETISNMLSYTSSPANRTYTIEKLQDYGINNGDAITTFTNNTLVAGRAGRYKLTVSQPAHSISGTSGYNAGETTITLDVVKNDIVATITPDNAVWNEQVRNPFAATSKHPVSGQVTIIDNFNVEQQPGNEHIALMDTNTRYIQTYYTNGDVHFLITRDEDDKYNALSQPLTLHVNQSNETCPLPLSRDNTTTTSSNNGLSDIITLDDAGGINLTFTYQLNGNADYDHYLTLLYSLSSNGDFTEHSNFIERTYNSSTPMNSPAIVLPDGTKRIRFKRTSHWMGSKQFQISNITVTRKKDLTPSESPVVLPVTSIGTEENKTFTLNWSTCADEILLTNSNPHFTIDKYNINPTNNQGSTTIKVTCDATVVDTLRDTIVIYDQTQRIFVPIECVVNDKFIANIKGTTSYSKMVNDTLVADFRFDTCQTSLPSADINAPLYYTIDHDLTGNDVQKPGFEKQVITYDPESNTIIAHNAGTAVLTFIQKPTNSHYTDTLRCTITVSKHDVERIWNDPVYFNDTISNYFTTTNTTSHIVIESQTDTAVAKLTNEFNPTSNNSLDLITFNKEASTTVTISQVETYYWNGYSIPHTITPIDPNNHVTFTLTQENYISAFKHSFVDPAANDQSKGPDWENEGIYFGGEGLFEGAEGWNWDEKYFIIQFTGIPDSIYFDASRSDAATGTINLSVSEGKTHDNLTEIWSNSNNTENNNIKRKLNPDTRYLKLSYIGNLWGLFKNITVTELNEFRAVEVNNHEVDVEFLNFDSIQVNTSKTMSFAFKYANAGYKVELISTDPHFTINPSSITDIGGENHGTRQIDVTYTSSVPHATNEDAMIIISDEHERHKDTVRLIASAYKLKQTLRWRSDFEAVEKPLIPLNGGNISDAAYSTSGLTIKYLSDNSNVIAISNDGTTLIPMGEGEATITATQTGNELWNPAESITKTFVVTDKRLQYIIWNDPLSDLVKSDNNQTITLTAQVYVQTEDGQIVYSPEQTAKLTYQSADTSIVSVSGSLLTIHSVGKTTLTAHVPATDDFAAATLTVPVIVRPETAGCEDVLLFDENGPIQFFQYSLDEIIKEAMPLDLNKGIPGYVLVEHYGESWDLAIQYYAAEIRVEESTDGGNSWNTITTIYPAEDKVNIDSIPLSRTATHIRFARNSGGQGYQFLQNIKVHPAQFIEGPDVIDFGQIHVGSREEQTFTISYSNIKSTLSPVVSSTDVVATPSSFGECGEFGTQTIQVFWTPSQLGENMQETVTFTDFNSEKEKVVILRAQNIQKGLQQLNWDAPEIIEHCGHIHFPEKTTADLPIKWEVIEGKQYADFVDGTLTLFQNGTIQLKGSNDGSNNYEPFEKIYTFQIAINPIFMGTEDEDWNNTNNWTMCRLPYPTEVVTMEHPATLSTHATVAGVIFSTNGSIHITHTGGLTINEAGVTNTATDGSSITIDNNPQGAGFLLISPSAPEANKYPYFTMNFTTRAFNEGVPRDETWQYMGAPGNNATFKNLDSQTLIYHWDETKGWKPYTVNGSLPTWQGYALTQSIQANQTYQITAQAMQGSQTINLTRTEEGMKGDNLFVNSFTAPIDITKIDPTTDVTGDWDYQTFYLFNTGSWNDWQGVNPDHKHDASSPGHYYTIPILSAQYLDDAQTVIPPMQGVYVHTDEPATITLDYSKHVWQGTSGNAPMRAPQKQDPNFRRIRIQASSENSGADRMYIIQESSTTRGYDNGYDGKNINASGQVNIYTNEPFGKMEVSCANDIDSMYIGFRAGSDSEYRLTFSSLIGGSIYIKDLEDNSITRMNEGGEYHFQATPNSVNHSRFQILLHPSEITDENTAVEDNHISKINIWIDNKYLHITDAPANSPATIYAISGQRITSYIVNTSHYTIPLSSLSNGIYILQIGDQRYKFVCK